MPAGGSKNRKPEEAPAKLEKATSAKSANEKKDPKSKNNESKSKDKVKKE
jgi:hypothetical protein